MINAVSKFSVRYLRADKILQFIPSVRQTFGKMHSVPVSHEYSQITVQLLPTLGDNYTYLVIDNSSQKSVLIDPADADVCKVFLSQNPSLSLSAILATHHHWDHTGGISGLLQTYPDIPVYTSDSRVKETTNLIGKTMTEILITEALKFNILYTPCHTKTHVCYHHAADNLVFTGDTLFIGGCGRFFEGEPAEMHTALNEKLGSLKDETLVFCGHEYTLANLKFGLAVEPDNSEIRSFKNECSKKRSQEPPLPTIPSSIGQEKKINPFMRLESEQIQKNVSAENPLDKVDIMKLIRLKKDNFKG